MIYSIMRYSQAGLVKRSLSILVPDIWRTVILINEKLDHLCMSTTAVKIYTHNYILEYKYMYMYEHMISQVSVP